jgi:hypothetical protein
MPASPAWLTPLPLPKALPVLPCLLPSCLQTGYEQHVRDGGCTSSNAKEGDERERLQRLRQLVSG